MRRTVRFLALGIALLLLTGASLFLAVGCRALFPKTVSGEARLATFPTTNLPLDAPVTIYWNEYLVPYIVAETDRDLAFTLGLFHGHFREAQMEILRKISQGRIAEMAGPPGAALDEALRRLDFGKAAAESLALMPAASRDWLEAYVEGVNCAISRNPTRPPESGLLGLDREPFTAVDLLTFGRLAGTDVNWLTFFTLLDERESPDFREVLEHVNRINSISTGSSDPLPEERPETGENASDAFPPVVGKGSALGFLNRFARTGSNTVALAPSRSADGHALIASDPHLGQSLPNLWTIVGFKSPGYHAVGLMIPGLPFLGLGRNEDIAWGGTNMRAASSDLVEASTLPVIEERVENIRVRFWPDRRIVVRETPVGPILSDADVFPSREGEVIALRWMGHRPSDEISAFLRASQASDVPEFLDSFDGYAVSGQNLVAVDTQGNIGLVAAVRLPARADFALGDILVSPEQSNADWEETVDSRDLPRILNPVSGFIASANNPPGEADVALGFLFNQSERIDRLTTLLAEKTDWTVDDLRGLQEDVFSPAAWHLSRFLVEWSGDLGGHPVARAVETWDGHYETDSEGAAAFELWLAALLEAYPGDRFDDGYYREWRYLATALPKDLEELDPGEREKVLRTSLARAEERWSKHPQWGDLHHLRVGHLLSALHPVGSFFVYDRFPAPGSRETVYKTAHGIVEGQHDSRYGSQSRHISSMADLDDNWFILFGGQDGWIGSEHFADQVPLWKTGGQIRIPLREETAKSTCSRKTVLTPTPR